MFLTESTNGRIHNADVTYSMELVQEATDAWTDLCDRMVALEHTAIVSEDAALLQEGKEEFKAKAKQVIERAVQKFMEWIEDVRVAWTNLVAKIRTSILNPDRVAAIRKVVAGLNRVPKDKIKVTCKADAFATDHKAITFAKKFVGDGVEKVMSGLLTGNNRINVNNSKDDLFNNAVAIEQIKEREVTVTKEMIDNALVFLKNRAETVKALNKCKIGMKKLEEYDKKWARQEKGQKKLATTQFHRAVNKFVLAINSLTASACRICNVVKKIKLNSTEKKNVKGEYKSIKAGARNEKMAKRLNANLASESVLNQFSL